jgi:hypothetical protein
MTQLRRRHPGRKHGSEPAVLAAARPPPIAYDANPLLARSVFASSPWRGEDNGGIAQQCCREVGVDRGRLGTRTEVTPAKRGQIDFREKRKSSRAILPPQGGGGAKPTRRARGKFICDSPALKGKGEHRWDFGWSWFFPLPPRGGKVAEGRMGVVGPLAPPTADNLGKRWKLRLQRHRVPSFFCGGSSQKVSGLWTPKWAPGSHE